MTFDREHGRIRDSNVKFAPLGLVPRQSGAGGKVKLGPISKRGNGYLRRLLVKLLATKPRKLAAVALANKMARIGRALMVRQQDFRAAPTAA